MAKNRIKSKEINKNSVKDKAQDAGRKSADINANYPLLGFRIAKMDKAAFLVEFEAVLELLSRQAEYRRLNLKKNAVFLRALELGLDQIRKRKSLA